MSQGVAKPFLVLLGAVAGAVVAVVGSFVLLARGSAEAESVRPTTSPPGPVVAGELDRQFNAQVRPFLQTYCFKCHGNGKSKGDVTLDGFPTLASVRADLDTWQSVHDELEQHEMPPKKAPQPKPGEAEAVLKFATTLLDGGGSGPLDPGFVPIHRLNRNEYNNTVRDLVGVDFHPADDFPADDTGYGFDNIADVLSMSPLLAEKYLGAAEQIMDKAIVTENPNKPTTTKYAADQMDGGAPAGAGSRELATNGEISVRHHFPVTGKYALHIEAEADQAGDEPAKMTVKVDGREVRTFKVRSPRGHSYVFTVEAPVEAGDRPLGFDFINDFYDPQNPNPRRRDRNLYVNSLVVEGPIDLPPPAPSDVQKRILFCGPADGATGETCAGLILRSFAGRAYRRPVTDDELNRLLALYRTGRSRGESFEQACKFALTAVLVSPQFLYRIEADPPHSAAPHPLNDYELASRLSYFLWSSMPDDVLLNLAGQNKLHDPATLDAQVKRMLADRRSREFVHNFAGQWLELRLLATASPDPKVFPDFDPALRDDMRQEGEMFFDGIVRGDRSVLDLLDSDYTFLNQRLADFYGIGGVTGGEFRQVRLAGQQAKRRGGVLSMAGVLMVSALPNRTSPVRRGKFILDQILGTPPPPPPPGVPALVDGGKALSAMSLRERLEQHRANPSCAACHSKLDPLGFALENYDAIGRWRDKDGPFPIDSTGSLPDGQVINGPDGLRQVLLKHKEQFLRCFVSKLMTYALGRGTTSADAPAIRAIYKRAERNDCRFSTIIDGIVHGDAFLKRRPKATEPAASKAAPTTGARS